MINIVYTVTVATSRDMYTKICQSVWEAEYYVKYRLHFPHTSEDIIRSIGVETLEYDRIKAKIDAQTFIQDVFVVMTEDLEILFTTNTMQSYIDGDGRLTELYKGTWQYITTDDEILIITKTGDQNELH